ncbi:hypothetical protein OA92_08365 [Marinomonas sp. SBI22]|uniref:hypothetical protein n=1 Tax=unclassified Marinomonas TaxID=196814 RepID=UPI0007AFB3BD|nr:MULTISPECIES: hypothetical protein [unclassified Marinomonas]KZM43688.1 hypothetical protein OA92_08365 [Marinomonas sp. SBI22]KZM47250.1 hypothetical protein OA91_01745 [Marinomonas sp. SBI8L]
MKNLNLIKELQHQGTWRLVILSIVTLTVYWAHYIARQSKIINTVVSDKEKISKEFISVLFVLSYFSLSMVFIEALLLIDSIRDSFVAFLINSDVASNIYLLLLDIDTYSGLVIFIMIVVWAVKVRNRMNTYCELNKGDLSRFNIFWSIVFTPYYFNYNVNCIMEEESVEPEAINL